MKKFIFLVLLFTSCKDTLTEKPKSLATETFYNTAEEVELAINAIYSPLRDPNGLGGTFVPQVEAYSDYAYGNGSYAILSQFQGLDPTNITRTQAMWNLFYLSIRNANLVIAKAPEGSAIAPEDVAPLVAEARFMRALDYFFLVRNWGGVVLRTEQNAEELAIPRSSAEEVYQLIEDDLHFAEENLPNAPRQTGRPSLWSAKSMLADVYFFQHKYAEAASKADEVIQSGVYSLVPVRQSEDFMNLFGPDIVTTPEEVFYLKFSRLGSNQGWWTVMFFHAPGSHMHGGGGYFGLCTSIDNPVYANWDDRDLRKAYNWYAWDLGQGKQTFLNKKFIDPAATNAYGAANDYPIYRYADILLLYAEAATLANQAPTDLAVERLNMVHRRAYGQDPLQPSSYDFNLEDYDQNTFADLVLKERGYETQMEGKRWMDLKRSGKVREIIKAATGKDIAEKHLLWPIPVSEMNFNEALDPTTDQNPGY